MLDEKSLAGLGRILLLSDAKDVRILELKLVPGKLQSRSRQEAIASILQLTEKPEKLLSHQNIKKSVLTDYLLEVAAAVNPKELTKAECISLCLQKWGLEDNSLKCRTEDEILLSLARLEDQEKKKIQEVKDRFEKKRKPLLQCLSPEKRIRLQSSSSEGTPSLASPSSSSQFSFPGTLPKIEAEKPRPSRSTHDNEEVRIIEEKLNKSESLLMRRPVKAEKICVTPDIKPQVSASMSRPVAPDSSDTESVFWVSW